MTHHPTTWGSSTTPGSTRRTRSSASDDASSRIPVGVARVIALVALATTAAYLTWRIVATIAPESAWLAVPFVGLELFGFVSLALYVYSTWDTESVPVAPPTIVTDKRLAILIPTYNEDREVLVPTVTAAVNDVKLAHEAWVLDDGKREWVREMAESLGARYLDRPDNSHAKAGNLNHALAYLAEHDDADLIAILDADHVPHPNLLQNTVAYFDDPELALVQTPQAFYNHDSFEHAGRYMEESMFYRVIQPGKNLHGAAFWCGTSAVVRTEALRAIGGVATETLTEDLHTTLRFHRAGWKTRFHNEVLAEGIAPKSYMEYSLQRRRWAAGAMQILRSDNPITGPGLTMRQRLAYAATLSGWFESLRTLGYLLIAVAVVVTGVSPIAAPMSVFIPVYAFVLAAQQITMVALSRGRHKVGAGLLFDWYRLSSGLRAVRQLILPTSTTFKVTPKGRTGTDRAPATVPHTLAALFALTMVTGGWFLATSFDLTPMTYADPFSVRVAVIFLGLNAALILAAIVRATSERFGTDRRGGRRFDDTGLPGRFDGRATTFWFPSLSGVQVRTVNPAEIGDEVELTIEGIDRTATVTGIVRRHDQGIMGVEFGQNDWAALAAVSSALYASALSLSAGPAAATGPALADVSSTKAGEVAVAAPQLAAA